MLVATPFAALGLPMNTKCRSSCGMPYCASAVSAAEAAMALCEYANTVSGSVALMFPASYCASTALMMSASVSSVLGPSSSSSGVVSTCSGASHGEVPLMSQMVETPAAGPAKPSGSRYSVSAVCTQLADGVGSNVPPTNIASAPSDNTPAADRNTRSAPPAAGPHPPPAPHPTPAPRHAHPALPQR